MNTIEQTEHSFVIFVGPDQLSDFRMESFGLKIAYEGSTKVDDLDCLIRNRADNSKVVLNQEINERELQVVFVNLVWKLKVINQIFLNSLGDLRLIQGMPFIL